MTTPDLERFGRIVRARREELGLQQEDMDEHAGPSSTTMSKVERGVGPAPSAKTLRKLDAGLKWQDGSAKRTLDGGDPTPLSPGSAVQKPLRQPGQSTARLRGVDINDVLGMVEGLPNAMEMVQALSTAEGSTDHHRALLTRMQGILSEMVMVFVMACELIGEAIAAEDITSDGFSEFAARLDTHAQNLELVRNAANQLAKTLTELETKKEGSNVVVSTDPSPQSDASTESGQAQEVQLDQAQSDKTLAERFGERLPPEPPRKAKPDDGRKSGQLGAGEV